MHNTHPYFYGATERSQVSYDFISRSLIMRHGRDRGSRCVHGHVGMRLWTCGHSSVLTRTCPSATCLCAFTETSLSAHLCCAVCAVSYYSNYSPRWTAGGKGRAAGCHTGWCVERKVGQCSSWNLTCARCQRGATATKACNWASAISWPSHWTLVSFVTSEKLAG